MKEENNINNMVSKDRIKEAPLTSEETVTEDPCEDDHYSSVGDNWAERVFALIAYAILIVGISLSILIGLLLMTDDYEWDNKLGKIILISGPIVSVIIWASFMIFVNISNNIRQIKKGLRRKKF